ncbi:MAG: hypothetical protein NTZ98_23260, partial [Acidobacteria bacterium]|nr:hypothetical protein [Acidobacteriota bacterium]
QVTMSNPGTMGLKSDCNTEGYVLASYNHGTLAADGSLFDNVAAGGWRVPLNLDLLTGDPGVSWTRTYDAGRGTSGVFNGCYGETYANVPPGTANLGCYGRLWIMFGATKGSTVTFLWNFDCYEAQGTRKNQTIREHFSMSSAPIPFPAWTGGDISGRVQGTFDVRYYLNGTLVKSLTGGLGRHFDFDLGIKKLPLP